MSESMLGQRLTEARERARLERPEVQRRLDVSRQNLDNWERGKNEPDIATLARLAELYGVTAGQLVFGERGGDFYDGALVAIGRAAKAAGDAINAVSAQFLAERVSERDRAIAASQRLDDAAPAAQPRRRGKGE